VKKRVRSVKTGSRKKAKKAAKRDEDTEDDGTESEDDEEETDTESRVSAGDEEEDDDDEGEVGELVVGRGGRRGAKVRVLAIVLQTLADSGRPKRRRG
jgi:hypothetical protein